MHITIFIYMISQICNAIHQPASRAAVSTPAQFSFGPRDGGMQHLSSQWVCIFFLTTNPLSHHSRPQHWIKASQVLKEQQRERKTQTRQNNRLKTERKTKIQKSGWGSICSQTSAKKLKSKKHNVHSHLMTIHHKRTTGFFTITMAPRRRREFRKAGQHCLRRLSATLHPEPVSTHLQPCAIQKAKICLLVFD